MDLDASFHCSLSILSHWFRSVSLYGRELISPRGTSLLYSLGIVSHFIAMYRSSTAKYGNIAHHFCSCMILYRTNSLCLFIWMILWFYYTSNFMWYNTRTASTSISLFGWYHDTLLLIKPDEVGNMTFIIHQTYEMIPEVHICICSLRS